MNYLLGFAGGWFLCWILVMVFASIKKSREKLKCFEYQNVYLQFIDYQNSEKIADALTEYGKEGWEISWVLQDEKAWKVIMKRETEI